MPIINDYLKIYIIPMIIYISYLIVNFMLIIVLITLYYILFIVFIDFLVILGFLWLNHIYLILLTSLLLRKCYQNLVICLLLFNIIDFYIIKMIILRLYLNFNYFLRIILIIDR